MLVSALGLVLAQFSAEREIETVKFIYDAGNYALARQHVGDALRRGNFNAAQRIELLRYGGLSALALGDRKCAEEDFRALLRLDPGYVLDPPNEVFEEVKKAKKRSLIPNFLPFGAGQFLQGRTEYGVVFAVSEAVLGVTSLIAYLAIEMLFQNVTMTAPVLAGDQTYSVRRIPAESAGDHRAWNIVKLSSGVAFYALAAIGIFDAVWHHGIDP